MINKESESFHAPKYRVAIPRWELRDEIAFMLGTELRGLGHKPVYFFFYEDVPEDIDLLLTFGPYGKILPIWQQAATRNKEKRPVTIHWNTEGIPDIRIPPWLVEIVGSWRSRVGQLSYSRSNISRSLSRIPPLSWWDRVSYRYRYYGDYQYAYDRGWLNLLFDTSDIYAEIRTQSGLPTIYAPWGASTYWYKDLNLNRDIDVLWMGVRGTQRRSRILDTVAKDLRSRGANIYIADNEENPFIFGDLRTRYLNRAKITLNITRTWYDDNFSRFALAAPNRSLVVSEPVLKHCREFQEGVHYISSEIKDLSKTILYYLENEAERLQIVENAYNFATQELRFSSILENMLQVAMCDDPQKIAQIARKSPIRNGAKA